MGDRRQAREPSQYITSQPGQLSLAIPPWVGAMRTSKNVRVNRLSPCTSPESMVSQCKLASDSGLKNENQRRLLNLIAGKKL